MLIGMRVRVSLVAVKNKTCLLNSLNTQYYFLTATISILEMYQKVKLDIIFSLYILVIYVFTLLIIVV